MNGLIPAKLSVEERGIVKVEAEKRDLKFRESKFNKNNVK